MLLRRKERRELETISLFLFLLFRGGSLRSFRVVPVSLLEPSASGRTAALWRGMLEENRLRFSDKVEPVPTLPGLLGLGPWILVGRGCLRADGGCPEG